MTLTGSGYGAGTRDLERLPERRAGDARQPTPRARSGVSLIEANLDDLLPELAPDAAEACFDGGRARRLDRAR